MRPRRSTHGFTLVELLVVIAIIGILAGFILAGYPRVLRMAKMSAMKNNMNQIRTILTAYYVDNNSFPPAYGYLSPNFLEDNRFANPTNRPGNIFDLLGTGDLVQNTTFFLLPWMSHLREHGNDDLYDNWSRGNSFDTDGDGVISRLEFSARGQFISQNQSYDFHYCQLYAGANGSTNPAGLQCTDPYTGDPIFDQTLEDLNAQLSAKDLRPFVYIPVNERQARQFRKIIYDFAIRLDTTNIPPQPVNPRPFNLDALAIDAINTQLSFPPPSYDAFVLMSVGPNFSTGTNGLVAEFDGGRLNLADFPAVYQYHILGLATYFMATRDADYNGEGDKELDFDFTARTSAGQGKNSDNDMPGSAPKGDGPVIYVGGA